jgi:uncharacterized membrane protein YcaP (DUF421 family)
MTGKRDVGEMSPSDLILLLLLSANVHTSLAGDDKSVTGGLIGALVLILLNLVLNKIAFKNRKFEKFLKGEPEVVILKGEPQFQVMKRHQLTHAQLEIAIHKEGLEKFSDVKFGILETDGTISIIKETSA